MIEKLPRTTMEAAQVKDKEKAAAERARDPQYYLTIRVMAAFYMSKTLPSHLTLDQALAIAKEEARSQGFRCSLNTPENLNYFLDGEGELEQVTTGPRPHMEVSGKAFRLGVEEE